MVISVWPETFKINEFLTFLFFKLFSPRSYRLVAGVMYLAICIYLLFVFRRSKKVTIRRSRRSDPGSGYGRGGLDKKSNVHALWVSTRAHARTTLL